MRTTRLIGALLAGAAVLAPLAVAAQDIRNVPVQERPRPDYDPLGIRARAFLIYPSLTLGTTYNDNIFATENDETDDFIFTVRPQVNAESQWSRHALGVTAFGDFGFYLQNNNSDYQDFGIGTNGRLDWLHNSRTYGSVGFARLHDDREDPDDAQVSNTTQYWQTDLNLRHRHEFARFFVEPRVGFRRLDYEDAGGVSNNDRDRNRYLAGLRSGFALSPRITPFAEVTGDAVEYDETPVDRDSQGIDARVGTEIDFTGIIFGELSAGYTTRTYDGDDFNDANGFAGNAAVTWNVTPLTSLIFDANSAIEESTVVYEGDQASGRLSSGILVSAFHELRRNVILNAETGYVNDDFQGTSRTDHTFNVGGGVTYLINRRFSVDANYQFRKRDSDDNDAEFTRNIFRIGLVAKL